MITPCRKESWNNVMKPLSAQKSNKLKLTKQASKWILIDTNLAENQNEFWFCIEASEASSHS